MRVLSVLVLVLTVAAARTRPPQRIVGGSVTTIEKYPEIVSLTLIIDGVSYGHSCGGTILNIRSILTAGHCIFAFFPEELRVRAGSTYTNSGGVVVTVARFIEYPNFNDLPLNNDIAIMRLTRPLGFTNAIRPARVAGTHYVLHDNEAVWAAGWGAMEEEGPVTVELRHVELRTVNHAICRANYGTLPLIVTESMLCSGWLGVGGRDQCHGDSGGPLYHNGVLVGVCSWGHGCGSPKFPGISVRVTRFTSWIQANA